MPSVWVLYYERFDDFGIHAVYDSEVLAGLARQREVERDSRLQKEGHVDRDGTGWKIQEYPVRNAVDLGH